MRAASTSARFLSCGPRVVDVWLNEASIPGARWCSPSWRRKRRTKLSSGMHTAWRSADTPGTRGRNGVVGLRTVGGRRRSAGTDAPPHGLHHRRARGRGTAVGEFEAMQQHSGSVRAPAARSLWRALRRRASLRPPAARVAPAHGRGGPGFGHSGLKRGSELPTASRS